jgi:predicted lactoylglutathione lyase
MKLPPAVPELPVTDIRAAADAYAHQMGFTVDWKYEDHLAGISRDATRVFLRRRTPEEESKGYSVLVWLNMSSTAEVDQLHAEWKGRGVLVVGEPQTTPYGLREFIAQDPDGNRLRVFFDAGGSRE